MNINNNNNNNNDFTSKIIDTTYQTNSNQPPAQNETFGTASAAANILGISASKNYVQTKKTGSSNSSVFSSVLTFVPNLIDNVVRHNKEKKISYPAQNLKDQNKEDPSVKINTLTQKENLTVSNDLMKNMPSNNENFTDNSLKEDITSSSQVQTDKAVPDTSNKLNTLITKLNSLSVTKIEPDTTDYYTRLDKYADVLKSIKSTMTDLTDDTQVKEINKRILYTGLTFISIHSSTFDHGEIQKSIFPEYTQTQITSITKLFESLKNLEEFFTTDDKSNTTLIKDSDLLKMLKGSFGIEETIKNSKLSDIKEDLFTFSGMASKIKLIEDKESEIRSNPELLFAITFDENKNFNFGQLYTALKMQNTDTVDLAETIDPVKLIKQLSGIKNLDTSVFTNLIRSQGESVKDAGLKFITKYPHLLTPEQIQKSIFPEYNTKQIAGILKLSSPLTNIDYWITSKENGEKMTISDSYLFRILKDSFQIEDVIKEHDLSGITEELFQILGMATKIALIKEKEDEINENPAGFLKVFEKLDKKEIICSKDVYSALIEPNPNIVPMQLIKRIYGLNGMDNSMFSNLLKHLPKELVTLETIENILKFDPTTNTKEVHENYRVRVSGFASSYQNANQNNYSELMYKGVLMGEMIAKEASKLNISWDLDKRINFFASYRKAIAEEFNLDTSKKVGELRSGAGGGGSKIVLTDCSGIYKGIAEAFTDFKESTIPTIKPLYSLKDANKTNEQTGKIDFQVGYYGLRNAEKTFTTIGKLQDKEGNEVDIELTKIVFYSSKGSDYYPDSKTVIFHTTVENGKKIMEQVVPILYKNLPNVKDAPIEKDKPGLEKVLKEQLGEIFWWICQAKPWGLGDPSIAELFIRSVWLEKTGTLMPPWKEDLIPWEKTVTIYDVNKYKKEFSNFLDDSFGYPPPPS